MFTTFIHILCLLYQAIDYTTIYVELLLHALYQAIDYSTIEYSHGSLLAYLLIFDNSSGTICKADSMLLVKELVYSSMDMSPFSNVRNWPVLVLTEQNNTFA